MQSLSSSQIDSFFCLDAVVSLPAQHAAVSSVCLPSPVLYTPTTPPPPERCFGVCINAALVCACPPPLPCILHRHSSRRQQNVWVSARRLSAVPSTKGRAHTYEQAPALCHAVSYVCLCVTNSLMAARCVMRAARVRGVGGGSFLFRRPHGVARPACLVRQRAARRVECRKAARPRRATQPSPFLLAPPARSARSVRSIQQLRWPSKQQQRAHSLSLRTPIISAHTASASSRSSSNRCHEPVAVVGVGSTPNRIIFSLGRCVRAVCWAGRGEERCCQIAARTRRRAPRSAASSKQQAASSKQAAPSILSPLTHRSHPPPKTNTNTNSRGHLGPAGRGRAAASPLRAGASRVGASRARRASQVSAAF